MPERLAGLDIRPESSRPPISTRLARQQAGLRGVSQRRMTEISFADRVVIVTGGGRGLGEAYCRELARRGAAVVVHDNGADTAGSGRDPVPANDVAAAIVSEGGRAVPCNADASSADGGQEAVDLAIREYGRLDAIVANAGIAFNAPLDAWPAERFEALLRHHVLAAFNVVRPGFEADEALGLWPPRLRILCGRCFWPTRHGWLLCGEDGHARADERRGA